MLILTRKSGESVMVDEHLVTVLPTRGLFDRRTCHVLVEGVGDRVLLPKGAGLHFCGGVLRLNAIKRPGFAALAFDFPPDVKIQRAELAKC